MKSDLYGPNTVEINETSMLLTTAGGGVAVHLPAAEKLEGGRGAVPDLYFGVGKNDRVPAAYDRAALIERRWSEKTLCGREWAVMVGGDGGAVGRYGEVAFAPTCRRCLSSIDKLFPKPVADDRLALVTQLAADVVDQHGFAEIHDVQGDQQDQLRKSVRASIRERTGHAVRTYSISGVVYVECQGIYDQHADRHGRAAAEAIGAVLAGEPAPERERDWVISWSAWGVA